jgi:hypothetical protein
MGRVRVVQRWQDLQVGQQLGVMMTVAQAEALHLLHQAHAGFDRSQRQLAHTVGAEHFAHLSALHHADPALAVGHLELN